VLAPLPVGAQSTSTTSAAPPKRPEHAALAAAIDSIAEAALREGPIPAISIAVVRGSDTIALRGYGYAELENEVPASAETVYRIGSITKQFTAAAILRLVEQGRISLEDPVSKHLAGLPEWSQRVTVHQLLNHTSGIRSYTGLGPKWTERMRLDLTHDELVALFRDEPADFAPGERWLYNNSAYYLAGMIIEKVTGQSYGEYLQQTFFEPLGLDSTIYCDQRPIIKHRAAGYSVAEGKFTNAAPLSMHQPFSAGALCSTVRDLVKWREALTSGRVITPASYARMTTATPLSGGKEHPYGYGLSLGELQGHRFVAHGGGINGFITYLSYYLEQDLTIAVLTNSGNSNPSRIERQIARRVLGLPEPAVRDLPLNASERARYVGSYDARLGKLQVLEEDGKLKLEGPLSSVLLYQGEHTFIAAADSDVRVVFQMVGGRASGLTFTASGSSLEAERVP
jgi:CubicO group peptidase (beta-lactamase class C family)